MLKRLNASFFGLNITRIIIFIFYISVIFFILGLPKFISWLQHKDELSICTFADLMPIELIEKFQEQTGIKVNVKYCELDPEFWAQLSLNSGHGLDVITPTDFVASRLVEAQLVQKVNKSLLENMNGIHESFLHKDFDPGLDYCIPFSWNYYAIGYNKDVFDKAGQPYPLSLQAIFEPNKFYNEQSFLQGYKVALFEDNPQELIFLAALYLFQNIPTDFSFIVRKRIQELFLHHKNKWLYAFVSANMRYYLDSVVPVVLCFASLLKDLLEEAGGSRIGSCYPKEGSVVVPQSFCIPVGAKNVKAAHKFIDFFMKNDVVKEVFEAGGYLPVKMALLDELRNRPELATFIPSADDMQKLVFINQALSSSDAESLWFGVKV